MGLLDQMMASLYKPPKQEKTPPPLPKNLTPARAARMAAQTNVTQGQLLRGEVLDLRARQIMVLLENGATVTARTEGTLNLSIGQHAQFLVAQTTEDQILLKLAQEETQEENPMIEKALTAANIIRTDRSVAIVTELLAHQQPVTEKNIRHYLSLSTKHPELPVKNLILMDLHHIPVTKENVEQFSTYQDRNGKLLTQAQDMLKGLAETIKQLPEGNRKQEAVQELVRLMNSDFSDASSHSAGTQNTLADGAFHDQQAANITAGTDGLLSQTAQTSASTPDGPLADTTGATGSFPAETTTDYTSGSQQDPLAAQQNPQNMSGNPSSSAATDGNSSTGFVHTLLSERTSRPDSDTFLKEFLNSFLLKPEDIADPEKVQEYYDELNEKLDKLEQLSQKLAESTKETASDAPKQMRSNLSFMEAVNQVFPYVQLPLKFREAPAHGELYVYEKKRALKPSDTLSALLHLEPENLGTTDIFVTLSGHHVTTRFSMTDKESGELIRSEMPELTKALAAKGYTLQSEVTVRESLEEENTPTLLEQFLEEHAPGGLDRYTFDIRA